mmetsp:Transcript_135551/g.235233  ORF Transcript_135551/g.235233 Transcript_135551/m.235233 type:complete len:90 (-) Transcript_135551:45-314(-)
MGPAGGDMNGKEENLGWVLRIGSPGTKQGCVVAVPVSSHDAWVLQNKIHLGSCGTLFLTHFLPPMGLHQAPGTPKNPNQASCGYPNGGP